MTFAEVARATVDAAPRAIVGDLVLCAVSPAGNRDVAEVMIEAGLLLYLRGAMDEAVAGTLADDTAGGVFHRAGADLLPIRIG